MLPRSIKLESTSQNRKLSNWVRIKDVVKEVSVKKNVKNMHDDYKLLDDRQKLPTIIFTKLGLLNFIMQ